MKELIQTSANLLIDWGIFIFTTNPLKQWRPWSELLWTLPLFSDDWSCGTVYLNRSTECDWRSANESEPQRWTERNFMGTWATFEFPAFYNILNLLHGPSIYSSAVYFMNLIRTFSAVRSHSASSPTIYFMVVDSISWHQRSLVNSQQWKITQFKSNFSGFTRQSLQQIITFSSLEWNSVLCLSTGKFQLFVYEISFVHSYSDVRSLFRWFLFSLRCLTVIWNKKIKTVVHK